MGEVFYEVRERQPRERATQEIFTMNWKRIIFCVLGMGLAAVWAWAAAAPAGSHYAGMYLGTVIESQPGKSASKATLYVAVFADGTMMTRAAAAPANKVLGDVTVGLVNGLGAFTSESLTFGVPFKGSLALVGNTTLIVNYTYQVSAGTIKGAATLVKQK